MAVNVTGLPAVDGFTSATSTVLVATPVTVWVSAGLVLPVNPLVPL